MTKVRLTKGGLPYRPCAGIVLINKAGKVWIGHRSKEVDAKYNWQLPQGGIDKGETASEAAMRELYEEVGTRKAKIVAKTSEWLYYDLPPEVLARKKVNKWGGQRQKYFAMKFLGKDSDVDLEVHHPEFDDWRWADIEELPGLCVPFKRAVYKKVVAEFTLIIEKVRAGTRA